MFEAFRFISRWRERQERREAALRAEREAERLHQREMLQTVFSQMVAIVKENSESIKSVADAMKANSDTLQTWLRGFQTAQEALPSHTVREEDEWVAEQRRLFGEGDANAFPVDLPPEFQTAFILQQLEKDRDEFDRGS